VRVIGTETFASVRPDGTYALDGVPFTAVELSAERDGLRAARVHFEAGGNGQWDAVLEDLELLRGRVVDDEGRPLQDWHVCLLEGGDSPVDDRARDMSLVTRFVMTCADGSFELDGVPASGFALAVRGPGFGGEDGPALVLTDLVAPTPFLLLRVPRAALTSR
jgi:hypothetical protein